MFKVIRQVVIIITFILLTVFSAVYFQDGKSEKTTEENLALTSGVIKVAGFGASVLNSLTNIANPKSLNSTAVVAGNYDSELQLSSGVQNSFNRLIPQKAGDSMTNSVYSEKSEFREFMSSYVRRVPAIYLDTKIYSNAAMNFWSALSFSSKVRD